LELRSGNATAEGDVILYTLSASEGVNYIANAYVVSSVLVFGDATAKIDGVWGNGAALWGPASCAVQDAASLMNIQGGPGSWSTYLLVTGALTLRGATTGCKFVSGAVGTWNCSIALTTSSLNSVGTLQDLNQFGAKYAGVPGT
jgi:hypothetical protein